VFASTISPETFLQRLPLALCTCDVEGRITDYNLRAVELWGHEPAEGTQRFSGAPRIFDHRGRLLVSSATPVALALASGTPQCNRELIIERADSTRVAVLSNVAPLFDESGTLVGAVDVFQDISERKRSEEARRVAERVAASLRIAADLGQEIRSSVQSATHFLEALKQEASLGAEGRFYAESALQELERLARITQRFLVNPATSTTARPNSSGVDS
jgi:PAS domain S-box-containing protein